MIGLFSNCEKDGDEVTILENPVAPALTQMPDLTLERSRGAEMLVFQGRNVDVGFTASATYFLEACAAGNSFENVIRLFSGNDATSIEIPVSSLNEVLLKSFPEDQASSVDFRLRAVLVADAGAGVDDLEYVSDIVNASVTLFGLPRLDLIGSGIDQKIVSPQGDGTFVGYVNLSGANAFTLSDPETGKTYGLESGSLVEGSSTGLTVGIDGYYRLNADLNNLTYETTEYRVAIVGSATPGGWDTDTDMAYDPAKGHWYITIDLLGGEYIKFRMNDGWGWNMGLVLDADGNVVDPESTDLQRQGVGNDILIQEAGNYTVYFTIIDDGDNGSGTYELVKN